VGTTDRAPIRGGNKTGHLFANLFYMRKEYIQIVKQIPVTIYDAVVGKIAVVESPSELEQALAGCKLRERGFRLYKEFIEKDVAEQMERFCRGDAARVDTDKFDLYVRCDKPHEAFGCIVIGSVNGRAYLYNGNIIIAAKLNDKYVVIGKDVKNVFSDSAPDGNPLDGYTLLTWSITQDGEGAYNHYIIHFLHESMRRNVNGFATITGSGDVLEMVLNE